MKYQLLSLGITPIIGPMSVALQIGTNGHTFVHPTEAERLSELHQCQFLCHGACDVIP